MASGDRLMAGRALAGGGAPRKDGCRKGPQLHVVDGDGATPSVLTVRQTVVRKSSASPETLNRRRTRASADCNLGLPLIVKAAARWAMVSPPDSVSRVVSDAVQGTTVR